ncbi:MAG: hypothetical protein O7C75_14880 [Verrucomicrobia bacterium]|nr:hypothetical protein [Verrucomicrobiota bacterium]
MPTGNTISTAESHEVANALYSDLLNFDVIRYGEGLNAGMEAIWAQRVGGLGLAVGAGYQYRGSYETWIKNRKDTWHPEDEVRFKGGVNFLKRRFAWHSGVTYIRYISADTKDLPALTTGLLLQNTLTYIGSKFSINSEVLAVIQTAETGYDRPKTILAGGLTGEYALTQSFSLRGIVSAKHIPDKGTVEAEAWLYSFGGGVRARVIRGIKVDVEIKVSTGHEQINQNNVSQRVDVRGVSIRSGIFGFF